MSGLGQALRIALAALVEVCRLVLVVPVREGRLRTEGWPPGLRAVAALALAAYLGAAGLVLAAPTARRQGDLVAAVAGDLILPRWSVSVFLALTVLAIALVYTATLHLAGWLRIATLVVLTLTLTNLVVSTFDQGATPHVATWVGCGLLTLFTALRWRAEFRWWEFVVALVVIATTVAVSLRQVAELSQPAGFDTAPIATVLTMQTMTQLAAPFVFLSGVAFAQLALLLVTRVGEVLDQRVRPTVGLVAVVAAMGTADVLLTLRHLTSPTESGASHLAELASALLLVAVAAAVAVLVLRRAIPATEHDLESGPAQVGVPIALLVTVLGIAQLFVTRIDTQLVRYFGEDDLVLQDVADLLVRSEVISGTRFVVGLGLVGWAVWSRRAAPALFAAAVGVTLVVTAVPNLTGDRLELPWTAESLNDVAGALVLLALAALAVTGRLTRARLLGLGLMLGLALAFSVRSTFDAPFVTLLGLGAVTAAFLSVVWATFTDADDANADSAGWPRPARVLLFAGNAVLAMSVLAFVQVTRSDRIGVDVSAFAALGDDYLGTGLLLAAYCLIAGQVVRGTPATATGETVP